MTPEDFRDVALVAAGAGAATIRSLTERGTALETRTKGEAGYVTVVDSAAEEAVLAILREKTPDIAVLAEESGGERADRMWVVDPLDGTTNYVRRFHVAVSVSVALMVDGQPQAGAVISPFTGQEWSAAAGCGAFHNSRRLDISDGSANGLFVTGFPFRNRSRRAEHMRVFEAAMETFEDVRRVGSAAADCAHVASGVWAGYFEPSLAVWDIAAGALLVREAGGCATDWRGDEAALFTSGDIVCGSPRWHERMLEVISATAASAAPAASSTAP